MTFLDGNRVTPGTEKCKCGPDCEMPCWQRIGLTSQPCCPDCGPLPSDEDLADEALLVIEEAISHG